MLVIAICNVSLSSTDGSANTSFSKNEALSGCETSSETSKNIGYCVKKLHSNEDVCVGQSSNGAVRCCGNY
jgi:hypothetical protein